MSTLPLNKPQYIFPRIGLIDITHITNYQQFLSKLHLYHGKYFNIFNLTNIQLDNRIIQQTKFKFNGVPYSICQSIKILNKIDTFLRINNGNIVIFCVNNNDSYKYVKIIIREYIKICLSEIKQQQQYKSINEKLYKYINRLSLQHQYFSLTLLSIYNTKQISYPPIKIISSFQLTPSTFIPIIQIYQQTRYNDYQLIYSHCIQQQLQQYYINLNSSLLLTKSFGSKYYDNKPQTKYLNKPVIITGDVKIVCYSFNRLVKKKQFLIGFNTKNMQFSQEINQNQGIIMFNYNDTYDRSTQKNQEIKDIKIKQTQIDQKLQIYVKVENWCDNNQCKYQSKCQQCKEQSKKINQRYNQTQVQLNKLIRQRKASEVKQYFSIQ